MVASDHPSHVEIDAEDLRARKRVEIGLSPARPTALENPQRPPDDKQSDMPLRWLLATVFGLMIVATTLLIFAQVLGAPTSWSQISSPWRGLSLRPAGVVPADVVAPQGFRTVAVSDFSTATGVLVDDEVPGRYSMGVVPDEGVFRFRAAPNQLVWTSPGAACLAPLRLQTSATVNPATADGYAGLVARINDPYNFYLFAVDGAGAYQVLLQRDGMWHTLQPWTTSSVLQPAGTANTLVVDDDGATLRFGANGAELFSTSLVRLPPGQVGIAGGARGANAVVDVDNFALFDKPCRGS